MSPRHALLTGVFLLWAAQAQAQTTASSRTDDETALVNQLRRSSDELLHETYRENNWEIYLRKADGSNPRNLTQTAKIHEMYPQASRDGAHISFVADERLDGKQIRSVYYMKRDGTGRTLVARNARQPCWSPDRKVIAYLPGEFSRFTVTDYATKALIFYDLATGEHRRHPNEKIHHL